MSTYSNEEKSHNLNNLLELLKSINLDFNWLLAVTSLSAQEVAIRKKLDELSVSYGESDFQQLVEKLVATMEEKNLEVPHILLSISRSYRHIRAKIIHTPHKTRLSADEAYAIFYNTEALARALFKKGIGQFDVSQFVDSIDESSADKMVKTFSSFDKNAKKQILEVILDKISLLDWKDVQSNKGLFRFLKDALKTEPDTALQNELFCILLDRTLIGGPFFGKHNLLIIIAGFSRSSSMRSSIKEKGYTNQIIAEFEMSKSFDMATTNAEIILNIASFLTKEQVNRIVDAALSNDQITFSWGARPYIKKLLSINRDKISEDKMSEILGALEQ